MNPITDIRRMASVLGRISRGVQVEKAEIDQLVKHCHDQYAETIQYVYEQAAPDPVTHTRINTTLYHSSEEAVSVAMERANAIDRSQETIERNAARLEKDGIFVITMDGRATFWQVTQKRIW